MEGNELDFELNWNNANKLIDKRLLVYYRKNSYEPHEYVVKEISPDEKYLKIIQWIGTKYVTIWRHVEELDNWTIQGILEDSKDD